MAGRVTSGHARRRSVSISIACAVLAATSALTDCGGSARPAIEPANPAVSTVPDQPPGGPGAPYVRATGTIRAVREHVVMVPRIEGQSGRLTLVYIAANGSEVKEGDILAEFDRTEQVDKARDTLAQFEDLSHQVEQKRAEIRSNAAKRSAELREAMAELEKAQIQLRIAPVLAQIERLKNEVKLADAKERVASLKKSHKSREEAEAAALRILELKRDRQKVALDRAQRNAELLVVSAPLGGMVALENVWRSGSMGPPQAGDQMYRGRGLLRIFDPSRMEIQVQVGEPDGAVLVPGARADVVLDAYPDLIFHAEMQSASPVAASALGSPIKRFNARFSLIESDPHLLPDLSAAVVIHPPEMALSDGVRQ